MHECRDPTSVWPATIGHLGRIILNDICAAGSRVECCLNSYLNVDTPNQGCELDRFLTEFELQRYLQVRVPRILFFELKFEFGKNNRVFRVRSPGFNCI